MPRFEKKSHGLSIVFSKNYFRMQYKNILPGNIMEILDLSPFYIKNFVNFKDYQRLKKCYFYFTNSKHTYIHTFFM